MSEAQPPALCPRCGGPLDEAGRCARCLLADSAEAAERARTSSRPRHEPPQVAELAPHFTAYELHECIGSGGMGSVYRAMQRGLGRVVAIKVLHPEIAAAPGVAERFQREARALASLRHSGIVAIHEVGQAGPWTFIAMEFVDGVDLRRLVRGRELSSHDALSIVVQVCEALQYAHDRGVVHRDIKPENILVDTEGKVRILDFGLAKLLSDEPAGLNLTATHQVMGTVHYMAPEQWEHPLTVDHRADIFSLGVVFYELLTGELPVGRFQPPSKRVEINVRLDEIVLRALEREPERRYQHASEVRDDVEPLRAEEASPQPVARAQDAGSRRSRSVRARLREKRERRRRTALATSEHGSTGSRPAKETAGPAGSPSLPNRSSLPGWIVLLAVGAFLCGLTLLLLMWTLSAVS